MRLKMRIDEINSRQVHCTFFSDPTFENNGTFANLGKLVMTHDEFRNIGVALGLGASQMKRRFILMPEDPKFMEWTERQQEKLRSGLKGIRNKEDNEK